MTRGTSCASYVPYLLFWHVVVNIDGGIAGHSEAGPVRDGSVEVGARVGGGLGRLLVNSIKGNGTTRDMNFKSKCTHTLALHKQCLIHTEFQRQWIKKYSIGIGYILA